MTDYTEDELRLARKIADAKYHSGERPGAWLIASDAALAAIRETTERAAQFLESRSLFAHIPDYTDDAVEDGRAIRNGEHLKDNLND